MNTTKQSKKASVLIPVLCTAFNFIAFLCFFSARWFVNVYGRIGFDSILYTLRSSLGGVQSGLILQYLLKALLPCVVCTCICFFLFFMLPRISKKQKAAKGNNHKPVSVLLSILLSLFLILFAAFDAQFVDYVIAQFSESELYEDHYADPNSVTIQFPEEKRNLIYIMLESMETSYLSEDLGGALDKNLIPELYDLAKENTCFSHSESDVGGFYTTKGATWTVGAMVAQTAGIPLKTPTEDVNQYGASGEAFLPGVTSITDILHDAGYYQALMVGSDATFGGRKQYYLQHSMDTVYDLYTARKDGIVPPNYFVWWGMEDMYLFEYAKQELTEIAGREEPFAFTMLTVDTHHIGGYQCAYCTPDTGGESYDRSISCSSRQVADFVRWIQAQPFYENTTVIIVGDHESMDNGYFQRNVNSGYQRLLYNCFINSPVDTERVTNRQFAAVDLFPTTLAAIGCTIEGDRLGLGTNLYSNIPTLTEVMGFPKFNNELAKASDYYTENFHK